MKKNVGSIDKAIRILMALVIVVLAFTKVITGTLAIVLLVFAGIFVLTSLISFCPIWKALGISSIKKQV
jgi:hypothetical protein